MIVATRSSSSAGFVCALLAAACVQSSPLDAEIAPDDWPGWRGPGANGIASPEQNPPVRWSEEENVLWKAAIPGRGHGSPTVVGDHLYLATADESKEIQSVLCLDRASGRQLWSTAVHRGGLDRGGHRRASQASSSVACDGKRLFVNFLNDGAVHTSALDRRGKLLWQKKISDFVTHQGFGSSPALHGPLAIVTADNKGGGAIAALERDTGRVVWSHSRPELPNYTSPVILEAAGREQLLVSGCDLVSSFDPLTGKKLWEISGSTTECVVTMVTDGQRVFTGGGYPRNHAVAIEADGSGKIAWENSARVYVPSMLARDGHLYAVLDAGFAVCWKSDTGEELWKERLASEFFSSPVMVGDVIYATNVRGRTFVFKATPAGFELLSENQLGDESYASPSICGSRIYLRVVKTGDDRREFVYCIDE